ncbi:MAG: hypothetical protein NNA18_10045 [Nitrospira sp.]|nr:hypothetical protein [Nitrospira sp.]
MDYGESGQDGSGGCEEARGTGARGDPAAAVPGMEGRVRERREVVRARQQVPRTHRALINTIRGSGYQEGHRLPEKFFARPT